MKSILSILVIAVCVGVYFVYIKPMTIDVKVQMAKKADIDKVLNTVKEIKEKRDAIFEEYNSISPDDIEKLNKIIPETINSVVILNDLSVVASEYGLTIKEYRVENNSSNTTAVEDVTNSSTYKKTKLSIRVSGSYNNFIDFLKKVESSLMIVDIVSLSIKQESISGNGPVILEYMIEANVYSLK